MSPNGTRATHRDRVIALHDLDVDNLRYRDFAQGLPLIVAGLKSLIETGLPLTTQSGR